jgi:hypothetical protein
MNCNRRAIIDTTPFDAPAVDNSAVGTPRRGARNPIARLADLQLDRQERAALARQGFIAIERRPGGRPFYRLRFRKSGKLRSRYLGQSQELAEKLRRELAQRQREHRLDQHIARLVRQARRHRGEFQPIATKVPGIEICELLPRMAASMDRMSILRAVVANEQRRSGGDRGPLAKGT